MIHASFMFRIAVGVSGVLIIGAAAFAQTPAPAPAAPASGFPPTATITTPGYPAAGPADPAFAF